VPIDGWGPNENYATMWVCTWLLWPTFNFCNSRYILGTAIVRVPTRAVCAVHSMQSLPNYFGLLFALVFIFCIEHAFVKCLLLNPSITV